jgi:hypothetical protein
VTLQDRIGRIADHLDEAADKFGGFSMTVRLIPYEALKSKGVPYSKPHPNDGEIYGS